MSRWTEAVGDATIAIMAEPMRDTTDARPPEGAAPEAADERFTIRGVSFAQYEALRDMFDDRPGLRMTYLEGVLELMSPSPEHERIKTLVARLIELYALERNVDLDGYGSATFRKADKERGVEPDECYCIGEMKDERPDIAFEVVLTSGGLDKLAVYAGLGVPEVWFWKAKRFEIFRLGPAGYEPCDRSDLLPGLDFTMLAEFVGAQHQAQAVRAYRDRLRQER